MNKSELDKIFTDIAQRTLGIETLEDRRSDRLDSHDVPVVRLRDALEAAFMSGVAHVKTQEYKAVYASLDVDIDDGTPDINVKFNDVSPAYFYYKISPQTAISNEEKMLRNFQEKHPEALTWLQARELDWSLEFSSRVALKEDTSPSL